MCIYVFLFQCIYGFCCIANGSDFHICIRALLEGISFLSKENFLFIYIYLYLNRSAIYLYHKIASHLIPDSFVVAIAVLPGRTHTLQWYVIFLIQCWISISEGSIINSL